jgi:hypothetical protein
MDGVGGVEPTTSASLAAFQGRSLPFYLKGKMMKANLTAQTPPGPIFCIFLCP